MKTEHRKANQYLFYVSLVGSPPVAKTGPDDKYPCPADTDCENEKMRIVNGVETICKCCQWQSNGICRENGWKLIAGPGECTFLAN